MADTFGAVVILQDSHLMLRRLQLVMDSGVITPADAKTALTNFLADLRAASKATVKDAYITNRDDAAFGTPEAPPPAEVSVRDEAAIICYIESDKLYTLALPAPEDTVWQAGSNGNDLDATDLVVQDFVENFISGAGGNFEVSDGEQIDAALGTEGIKYGYWRQRAASAA